MHRNDTCLDFTAKKINIEAHVGDDIRFGVTLNLSGEPLPAADYNVETFIYDENDTVIEDSNFEVDKQDGVATFELPDSVTTGLGVGSFSYSITISLVEEEEEDYDRTYINGILVLKARSVSS